MSKNTIFFRHLEEDVEYEVIHDARIKIISRGGKDTESYNKLEEYWLVQIGASDNCY